MRKKIIAGNWKMNNDIAQTAALINGITSQVASGKAEVIVCPPFTSLLTAGQLLAGSAVKLGAQDVSLHDSGAYTGEISVAMLKSVGCAYVIVGHSERRQYHAETNEIVNRKAKKVLAGGLLPIIRTGLGNRYRKDGNERAGRRCPPIDTFCYCRSLLPRYCRKSDHSIRRKCKTGQCKRIIVPTEY